MNFFYKLFFTRLLDFEVLYKTTKDLLLGNNPYINPEIFTGLGYPPNTLLFYIPFTFFNQNTAQLIFSFLNLVFLLLCVLISLKIIKKRPKMWEIIFISFLLFLTFPARHTLLMGQNNFFAYTLLLLSFYFLKNKKGVASGILLGLSISFKTIFIFYLLFFFLKKQKRILFYANLTIILTILITTTFFDPHLFVYWYKEVLPPLFNYAGRETSTNQGISGFVSRIFTNISIRKTLTYTISGLLVGMTALKIYKTKNLIATFSLFLITLNLIDSLAWQHHFVWLLLPFIYLGYNIKSPRNWLLLIISYILNFLGINFWGSVILYYIFISILTPAGRSRFPR